MRMNRTDHKIANSLHLCNIIHISCIICNSVHLVRVHSDVLLESSSTDASIIGEVDSLCLSEVLDELIDVGSLLLVFLPMVPFFIWLVLSALEIRLFHQLLFPDPLVVSIHPSQDLLRFVFGELIQSEQEVGFDVSQKHSGSLEAEEWWQVLLDTLHKVILASLRTNGTSEINCVNDFALHL